MADMLSDFEKFRAEMNQEIQSSDHLGMKRFFALDHQVYEPGARPSNTKELLGLVVSAVLRCDDCITHHIVRCAEAGWKRAEIIDALNVALIVGGSIVIPHVRRAFARMREIPGLNSLRHSLVVATTRLGPALREQARTPFPKASIAPVDLSAIKYIPAHY